MVAEVLTGVIDEVSQVLLVPCLAGLCFLALLSVVLWGDMLCEFFMDKRYRKRNGTQLLLSLHDLGEEQRRQAVAESGLSPSHKRCIQTLLDARSLSQEEQEILAGKLLADEEGRRRRTLSVTELIIRLGPMLGLLGTLIPLGPGIVALGQGDTVTLSNSMGLAFNTTIVGVASASLAYLASLIRRHWYRGDSVLLESILDCCLAQRREETKGGAA